MSPGTFEFCTETQHTISKFKAIATTFLVLICHYLSCINKTTPENITRYLVLHTSYIKKTSDNTLKRFVLKTVQIISLDLLQ